MNIEDLYYDFSYFNFAKLKLKLIPSKTDKYFNKQWKKLMSHFILC